MTKTKSKGPKIIEQGEAVEQESDLAADEGGPKVVGNMAEPAEHGPGDDDFDPDVEHASETRALEAQPHLVVNHGPSADVAKNDAAPTEEKAPRKPRERRTLDGQLLGLRASYAKHVDKLTTKRDNLKTQLEAVDLELGNAQRQLERIGRTLDNGDENETAALHRLTPPEPVPVVPDSVPEGANGASPSNANA